MKSFLFLSVWLAASVSLDAQNCIPDTTRKSPGMFPTGNSMDTVYIGQPYSETVTYFSVGDTSIVVTFNSLPPATVNARVDSVKLKYWSNPSALNLPPGLTLECGYPDCVFPGNTRSCVKVSGTVNNISDTGSYLSNIDAMYYFTILSSPFTGYTWQLESTVNPFSIVVKSQSSNGTHFSNLRESNRIIAYPNPCDDYFELRGLPHGGCTIALTDIYGKQISAFDVISERYKIFWPEKAASGIYFIRIVQDKIPVETIAMMKNN